MPLKSEAQRRKLQQINPEALRLLEGETPQGSKLPERLHPKPELDSRGRPKLRSLLIKGQRHRP